MARNYVQAKDYRLAGAGIAATDTSIVLTSMELPNSAALVTMADFGAIGFITLEPETDREENASFTGITQNVNGTATLTGVTRGLTFVSPSTIDTNLRKSHSGGTIARISNSTQFYENLANRHNTQSIFEVWSFTAGKNPKYLTQPASFGDLDLIDKAFLSTNVYDYFVDTGSADAIVITPTTALVAYTAGQHFFIKVVANNTGATTININGLGVKSLKKSVTVDLDGGDLLAGQVILVCYDGTNFQLVGGVSGGTTSGSGLSQISEVFSYSDFSDDGSGNGYATFSASLPTDAVPVGVVYNIATGFDATSTLKVLNSLAGAKVIGGSVVATAVNVLTGQTDGSNTSFDFGATPNPVVFISGVVPTQGVATVTILYSTSTGSSSFDLGYSYISLGKRSTDGTPYGEIVENNVFVNTTTNRVYTIFGNNDNTPSLRIFKNDYGTYYKESEVTISLSDLSLTTGTDILEVSWTCDESYIYAIVNYEKSTSTTFQRIDVVRYDLDGTNPIATNIFAQSPYVSNARNSSSWQQGLSDTEYRALTIVGTSLWTTWTVRTGASTYIRELREYTISGTTYTLANTYTVTGINNTTNAFNLRYDATNNCFYFGGTNSTSNYTLIDVYTISGSNIGLTAEQYYPEFGYGNNRPNGVLNDGFNISSVIDKVTHNEIYVVQAETGSSGSLGAGPTAFSYRLFVHKMPKF